MPPASVWMRGVRVALDRPRSPGTRSPVRVSPLAGLTFVWARSDCGSRRQRDGAGRGGAISIILAIAGIVSLGGYSP